MHTVDHVPDPAFQDDLRTRRRLSLVTTRLQVHIEDVLRFYGTIVVFQEVTLGMGLTKAPVDAFGDDLTVTDEYSANHGPVSHMAAPKRGEGEAAVEEVIVEHGFILQKKPRSQ